MKSTSVIVFNVFIPFCQWQDSWSSEEPTFIISEFVTYCHKSKLLLKLLLFCKNWLGVWLAYVICCSYSSFEQCCFFHIVLIIEIYSFAVYFNANTYSILRPHLHVTSFLPMVIAGNICKAHYVDILKCFWFFQFAFYF